MKTATKNTFTDQQIRTVLKQHFPTEDVTEIVPLTGGTFHTLYLIRGTGALERGVVLKTEPVIFEGVSSHERNAIRTEVCFYGLVEKQGLPIPRIYACDFSKEALPCNYFIMEYMEGKSWYELFGVHSPSVMREFGRYTAKIHAIKGDWFGSIVPDSGECFPTWGEAFSFMMESVLREIDAQKLKLPSERIRAAVAARRELLDSVHTPTLVNLDMWAGNVFLQHKPEYSISAIIDFERSFFGDFLASFVSAFLIYDDVEKEGEFMDGYNEISPEPLRIGSEDREKMALYELLVFLRSYCETKRYGFWTRSMERIGIRGILEDCLWRLEHPGRKQ